MADHDHDDYEEHSAGAGASETYPEQCSKLRKGGYVMIKNRPCKVMEMSTSKTGKHGHAKVHYVGLDIFTGKKYEDICPSTHSVNVPNVARCEYPIIDVDDDGFIHIMTDNGEIRQIKGPDKQDPEDIRKQIEVAADKEEELQAVIWTACGSEIVLDLKTVKQK